MNTRRHFIHSIMGAGATAALGAAAQPSYKGENIQFGLVTYMWGADWDLPTLIANCTSTGVSAVELRVEHAHKVDPSLTPQQRTDVRRQFEDSAVKLLGMGTNFEFHAAETDALAKNIAGAKEYIKLCHDIGGTGVKVKPNALPPGVPAEKTLEQIGKALAEIGDYAVGFGQEIRLEVHGKETSSLDHVRTIMEAADRGNVRVCWNCNGEDLAGEGIEANFAKVRDYLGKTVHIREVNTGDYPYDKLAALLVDADYEGFVCLEARTKPADRVAALAEQREMFMKLVMDARIAAKD